MELSLPYENLNFERVIVIFSKRFILPKQPKRTVGYKIHAAWGQPYVCWEIKILYRFKLAIN